MSDAHEKPRKKRKDHTVVIKLARVKRPTRVIRAHRSRALQPMISAPQIVPVDVQTETSPGTLSLRAKLMGWIPVWKGVRGEDGVFAWIFDPSRQFKLVSLALAMWMISIILFVVSYQLNARASYRLITLSGFIVATSLASIYTGLLGIQHLRARGTM
jgi:hypothetical protein